MNVIERIEAEDFLLVAPNATPCPYEGRLQDEYWRAVPTILTGSLHADCVWEAHSSREGWKGNYSTRTLMEWFPHLREKILQVARGATERARRYPGSH